MPQTDAHRKLVTGDLAPLEAALADAISSARAADPLAPVTVLVGHTLLRPYLRRALAMRGLAQINIEYVLPADLARRLAPETANAAPRLTPGIERLLVRDVSRAAGSYFESVRGRDGFTEALRRLFRELEGGGFTSDSFRDAAAAAAKQQPGAAAKLSELTRLYALYESRRAGFRAVSDDLHDANAAALEGPLLVYGTWSLPQLAMQLVERIAQSHDVTVFLPASGQDPDTAHAVLRTRIFPGDAPEQLAPPAPTGPPAVATALFGAVDEAAEAEGIELISAPDTVREVWEAARACMRWVAQGIRFHEMAVVYRNADPYRTLVDEIFREAGIPTYVHAGRLLAEHPLGRRVLALLDLAADASFSRPKVMEFLTETQLPAETLHDQPYASPSEWETLTREAGIIDRAEQWDERLRRLAEEKRRDAQREGYEWLTEQAHRIEQFAAFAASFAADLAARPIEATWAAHLAYLKQLGEKYASGVGPIIEALNDLHVLAAVREPVPFEVFCRAVRDDLESRDASRVLGDPVRAFGRHGVAVLDATSLRHLRFRVLCMLGVAERAWPAPPRPDPLLLEHERRLINAAGAGTLPLRMEPDEEALTFWLGIQAASEHLHVSYARADAGSSGKHLPSYFFRAVAEALEGRRLKFGELEASDHIRRFSAGRLAADEPAQALTAAEYDRSLVHLYVRGLAGAENVRALGVGRPSFDAAVAARAARWSSALTAYDGYMGDPSAIAAARARSPFGKDETVSASRLEMYAACPYRYFLRYVLRVEPLEEPETIDRINPLDRGTLIHAVLERFMREISPHDPPHPEARTRHIARLLEIAHAEGSEMVRRGVTGKALVWRIDERQIHEDLVRWYDEELRDGSGLAARGFEVGFGPTWYPRDGEEDPLSSVDPLVLRADGRELRLQGRIDRIDCDDAGTKFRVTDYKTGAYKTKVTLEGGKSLQLPLYLRAAARMLGIPPEHGGAEYFFVSAKGEFRRVSISGAETIANAASIEEVLVTIADGVESGIFLPNPGKDRYNCKYCDYADVCDAGISRLMERKHEAPEAAAFNAMGEIK